MEGGRTCRFDCIIILKLNFKIIKLIMSVLFSCVKFWLPTSLVFLFIVQVSRRSFELIFV